MTIISLQGSYMKVEDANGKVFATVYNTIRSTFLCYLSADRGGFVAEVNEKEAQVWFKTQVMSCAIEELFSR